MIEVKGAPAVEQLSFRRLKDGSDYALMSAISRKSWLADGFEWIQTEEDIAQNYADRDKRDPIRDIVLIDVGSETVGFGEILTERVDGDSTAFRNSVHLLPEWRGKGIREAVFDFNEKELLKRKREANVTYYFQTWANDEPNDFKSIVLSKGYVPSWHILEMVRSDLDHIPVCELPHGLEVRPVAPRDYRQIWGSMKEAFRGEPWYVESKYDDDGYKQWVESPEFSPELWQVAWDGDKVVGTVQSYVKKEENEAFGRKRGHTEQIFVAPTWQRKGVASALITRSLVKLRDIGMRDATLDVGVVADKVSGALMLYQSMGYRTLHHFTFYRKPIPQ